MKATTKGSHTHTVWYYTFSSKTPASAFIGALTRHQFGHSPQLQHHWAVIRQTPGCARAHWCGSPQTQRAQQRGPQLIWWNRRAGTAEALFGEGLKGFLDESDTQHIASPRQRRRSKESPRQQILGLCPGSPWRGGWAGSSQHPGWWGAAGREKTLSSSLLVEHLLQQFW